MESSLANGGGLVVFAQYQVHGTGAYRWMTGNVPLVCLYLPIPPPWHFLLPVLSSVVSLGQMAVTAFELSLLTYPGVG